jgi:DNA-binding MarR family transcriptional regulator
MKESAFNNRQHELAVYTLMDDIRKLTRHTLMFQHAVAEQLGLHSNEAECLDFLKESGQATAGDLARLTGLTSGAVTSMIDRLENQGFVERIRDRSDRRKVWVKLIPDPNEKAAAFYGPLAREIQNRLSVLSSTEVQMMHRFTHMLQEIYRKHIAFVSGNGKTDPAELK